MSNILTKAEQKKQYVELGNLEIQARTIAYKIRERSFDDDWSMAERILASAFQADWSSQRTREDWVNLAEVLTHVTVDTYIPVICHMM